MQETELTGKHFEVIAKILGANETICDIMDDLAEYFASVNPQFDRRQFFDSIREAQEQEALKVRCIFRR